MASSSSGFAALARALVVAVALVGSGAALARSSPAGIEPVALASLPAEAQATYERIRAGGPFPYERDGVVFGNYEKLLPAQPRGHYHEYTVPTPHAKNRGARRIVCGGEKRAPETCYYTDDHYRSFKRIEP